MQRPDGVVARTPLGDLEAKIGVLPLEELLAERDTLVKEAADLRARHGPFGTWDSLRKVQLSTVQMLVRAKALEKETKVTEAFIEQTAHAHDDYVAFITQGTTDKARWAVIENQIESINDTIQRGNALIRYSAAETHLGG